MLRSVMRAVINVNDPFSPSEFQANLPVALGIRWARSTRRSGIGPGDEVVVVRIDGVVLEVDPVP